MGDQRRRLGDIAKAVRSKNAGPFWITLDVFFGSDADFALVRDAGVLTAKKIGELYGVNPAVVRVFDLPEIKAMKFSVPRPVVAGSFEDFDLHAGQQYVPLAELPIPGSSPLKSEQELADARKHLAQGEDYHALTSCFDRFSAIVEKPYIKDAWLRVLPDDPGQKKDSLAGLLAAHCAYLNRVGYHRHRGGPAGAEQLGRMPLEHWEAELAVATSHFLLTLALRMEARKA